MFAFSVVVFRAFLCACLSFCAFVFFLFAFICFSLLGLSFMRSLGFAILFLLCAFSRLCVFVGAFLSFLCLGFCVFVFLCVCVLLRVCVVALLRFCVAALWGFVFLRAIQAAVHCTYNRVMHRFYAYLASSVLLWVMLVRFFLSLL